MNNYEDKTDDRKKTGGAAFPNKSVYGRCEACGWDENSSVPGMTLRDYFAAKAMQGIIPGLMLRHGQPGYSDGDMIAESVALSIDAADCMIAMLKERDKEE